MGEVSAVQAAAVVRAWARFSEAGLSRARTRIDALNVFPVPDGDTGTNLFLTLEAAAQSVREASGTDPVVLGRALAMGALLGARGNSGVIISQMLKGAVEALAAADALDGDVVRGGLHRAADLGYRAVARPVEGTILSVCRAAADGAVGVSAQEAANAAVVAAEAALARTPEQLESLRRAGVVDAGGAGLVVVLRALAAAITTRDGDDLVSGLPDTDDLIAQVPEAVLRTMPGGDGATTGSYAGPAYEVMFLLEADDEVVPGLRDELDALGESLVVVGGDRLFNVHVHVDDAGAAVEAALRVGRPYRIRVTYLESLDDSHARHDGRAVVAVSHGPGVAELLESADVVVVPAAVNVRPSTAEILSAIEQLHAAEVIVLPSDRDSLAVAEIAADQARLSGVTVAVIPTRSVVQTLAAVAVHDPQARFEADVVSMTRAAGATRYAAVTVATRAAFTGAGACSVGDVLGIVDGDIAAIGDDVDAMAREIVERMLAIGGELVTLVLGADASDQLRQHLPAWVARMYPLIEVIVHDGGQPLWPIIIGVE